MSFEHNLRDRLSAEASSFVLPDRAPEHAAGRAAQRRRARRATVAAVAGTAVLAGAVAVSPTVFGGDDGNDEADVAIAAPGASGLVPTGPLDVTWRATDAGLVDAITNYIDDEGTLFALSTSPGARYEDHPDGDIPRTLYRLGEDGTWEELALEGDRPDAVDMSGDAGLLYAISTGPGADGGTIARLSASSDGGDTWSTDDLPAVPAPGTPDVWTSSRTMSVESLGGHTVALVSTTWSPDFAVLFPEMSGPSTEWSYDVETRDEGLVLTRAAMPAPGDATSWGSAQTAITAPPQPTTTAAVEADRVQDMEEDGDVAPPEDVRTVPWSELGAEGPDAMTPQVQMFRRAGEAWEELPDAAAQFAGMVGAQLDTSGDRFVASGYPAAAFTDGAAAVPGATAFASADGVAWTPLSLPIDGTLTSVGPALLAVSFEGDEAQVSADGGATWSEVDLAAAGVGGDEYVMGVGGGPLGVALTIGDRASSEAHTLAVSGDLVDWTITPIAVVFGGDFPSGAGVSIPAVGEDTIALTRSVAGETSAAVDSLTVVGTPTR